MTRSLVRGVNAANTANSLVAVPPVSHAFQSVLPHLSGLSPILGLLYTGTYGITPTGPFDLPGPAALNASGKTDSGSYVVI